MKVALGCQARFHFFDLARQMHRQGHLQQLYTGYPRFKVKDLPHDKISTFPWFESTYMALGRLGVNCAAKYMQQMSYSISTTFDSWMERHLSQCDVFQWLSGAGLRSHKAARERYGALTICDRASSHIIYQQELMSAEFDHCGMKYYDTDARIVERELAEYESSDLIVVPSTFAKRSFVEKNVPDCKVRVVPFGVNLDLFRPSVKRDEVFRVLFVGQIGLRKGVQHLLKALGNLHLPQFELCLAGTVLPEAKRFLARYEGGFRYLGTIPHTRLRDAYGRASVFVLPSVEEGFAYVQAEAMACGLPVIATTNTGADDLYSDGKEGFIIPIRDPEAIRQKVLLLYKYPELREEMGRAALRRMRAIRGWNEYGERMSGFYKEQLELKAGKDHSYAGASNREQLL